MHAPSRLRVRGIRLVAASCKLADALAVSGPISFQTICELARQAVGPTLTPPTVEGLLRLTTPVTYLGSLGAQVVDQSCEEYLDDESVLEILGREDVRRALSYLTDKQRRRVAELVGVCDRPAETQSAIARELGVTPQAVSQSIAKGIERLRDTGALAELDDVAVEQASTRQKRTALAPRPKKRARPHVRKQ